MRNPRASQQDIQESMRDAAVPAARMNGLMADAVERTFSIFGHGVRAFQEEGVRFLTRRMEDNARAVQALGTCKNLPDLLVMQQRWLADMTRAYSEEWVRYGDIVSGVLADGEKATEETVSSARRASETH